MKLLAIGDVVGQGGREAVTALLPGLRDQLGLDRVVCNGENSAQSGRGITPATADELFAAGVDVITLGNHVWDQREIYPALDREHKLIRPINYPPGSPGTGYCLDGDLLVINAIGRTFMGEFADPFRSIDAVLDEFAGRARYILVDFHAETTSEKGAMAWYLDGRVGAVVGTHTHVPTADQRILPRGTAFISDLGMVGPIDSIIGVEPQAIVDRFLTQMPNRFPVADGPVRFNAVYIELDDSTGRAVAIRREDHDAPGRGRE